MTTRIDNQEIISNVKESYFIQSTPSAFHTPQFLSSSRDGKFLYALKFKYNLRLVQIPDTQLPEIQTDLEEKVVCKYHVFSGKHISYELDDDYDIPKLIRIIEFYTIFENFVVTLIYEPEKYLFKQQVLHLDANSKKALIVVERVFTITRIIGSPFINLALLDEGKVIICGVRGMAEGEQKIRMTISIPADPLKPGMDEDLSSLMEDFNKFLKSAWDNHEGEILGGKAMSLFLLSMNEERISIVLSDVPELDNQREPVILTRNIGRIDRKNGIFSIDQLDNSAIRHCEYLKVTALTNLKVRNESVWLSFSTVDVDKLSTFPWKMRHLYVRFVLRMMIFGFQGSLYLWRFDNGFSFTLLTKLLTWMHGPSMMPIFNPDKKFHLYHLDLKRNRFHNIEHEVFPQPERDNPNETNFGLSYDVDSSGGATIVNFPNDSKSSMSLTYYPNPTKPQNLARIAMYAAYRKFPSFEKTDLLRRLTGVFEWTWSI